jgi:hypothetical protein
VSDSEWVSLYLYAVVTIQFLGGGIESSGIYFSNQVPLQCLKAPHVTAISKAPHTHTVWPSIPPAQLKTERQNWRVWCSRPVNRLDCWTVGNPSVFALSFLITWYFETLRLWLWYAALSACRRNARVWRYLQASRSVALGQLLLLSRVLSTVSRCHFLERGILKLEDCDCGLQPYLPAGLSARVWGSKGRGQTVNTEGQIVCVWGALDCAITLRTIFTQTCMKICELVSRLRIICVCCSIWGETVWHWQLDNRVPKTINLTKPDDDKAFRNVPFNLFIAYFTMLSVLRLYRMKWYDDWWIMKRM